MGSCGNYGDNRGHGGYRGNQDQNQRGQQHAYSQGSQQHLSLLPFFQAQAGSPIGTSAVNEQNNDAIVAHHYLQRMLAAATAVVAASAVAPAAGAASSPAIVSSPSLGISGQAEFDKYMETSAVLKRLQVAILSFNK